MATTPYCTSIAPPKCCEAGSLTYYLTSLLQLLFGLNTLDALRWLLLLIFLTCSGGMYLFCKRRSGRLGALIAGLVYVYSPYLIYTEAYARGAFPELLAFAIFPLLLWRVDALRDKPTPINFLLVALLQVALVNSHNLMAATLTAICGAWVIFETSLQFINRETSQMKPAPGFLALLALMLGAAAAASFWFPIFFEGDSVKLENLQVPGVLDYRANFVRLGDLLSTVTIQDAGEVQGLRSLHRLGIAQWALALLGGASAFLLYVRGYRTSHPQAFLGAAYFALLATALIFLVVPASREIWDRVSPMHLLQFPWRLLGPIAICLAILASMNGLWLRQLQAPYQILAIAPVAALPILSVIPLFYVPYWRITSLDTSIAAYHQASEPTPSFQGTTATGEFVPRDVHSMPTSTKPLLADYADGYPIDKLNRSLLPTGAEAELLYNGPQQMSWRIRTPTAFAAELYNFYWLGWQADLNGGGGQSLPIMPSPNHGLIVITLPAGEYTLRVFLGSTPARDFAAGLSTLSLILLCAVLWLLRGKAPAIYPYPPPPRLSSWSLRGLLLGGGLALLILSLTFREGVAWLHSPLEEALPAQIQRRYTFDDSMALLGFDLSRDKLRPGDILTVNAYWYALEKIDVNFDSFLHLSSGGPPHAQNDKALYTFGWEPNGYVFHSYELLIPADLPAGDYSLSLGLYTCELTPPDDCGNGYRPEVKNEAGQIIGDSIPLAAIHIED